ncbi:MAG: hypothetical protein WC211_00850 [Dehalococcoidia bacterium]
MANLHTSIAEVTGSEPVTCPWRVYEDPVVQAGRVLASRIESGVVDIDRQLSVVVEAADVIRNVSSHLMMLDLRAKREQRTSEENMRRGAS